MDKRAPPRASPTATPTLTEATRSAEIRRKEKEKKKRMGRVATFFGLTFGVFVFMQSMETVHHWLSLYLDEKKERLEREMEIKQRSEESDSHA